MKIIHFRLSLVRKLLVMFVTVNCLLTASSYPQYILAEFLQSQVENSSNTGLTISTGQSNFSVSPHPSLLCYLSPLLSSLLSSSGSHSTIIIPSSSVTTLPLVMQLLYTGQCQCTQEGQVEDVSQLIVLLGLNMKIDMVACCSSSYEGGKTAEDTLFLSCENPLYKDNASYSNENIRIMTEDALEIGDQHIEVNEESLKTGKTLNDVEIKINSKMKPNHYLCDQCDYITKQQGHLKRHIRAKHIDRFECKLCEKTYSMAEALYRHVKSIHEEQSFTCPHCDYIAKKKGLLKRHIGAKHSLERFECKLCEKTYSMAVALNRHVKSIHEKKSYKCPQCSYVSSRQDVLKCHIKCKHSQETVICDECGYQAATKMLLKKHKRRAHEG